MSIKICGGIYKGVHLHTSNTLAVRPTSQKVRCAVFNILAGKIDGAKVLDLFAGTGAVGLEALSRGAREVVFVENSNKVFKCLKQNIEIIKNIEAELGIPYTQVSFLKGKVQDLFELIAHKNYLEKFDLIWADPPYNMAKQIVDFFIKNIYKILHKNGLFVIETNCHNLLVYESAFARTSLYKQIKVKGYGDTVIMFYEKLSE